MVQWYVLMLVPVIFATIGSIIEKKTLFKEHAMEFSTVFAITVAAMSLVFIPFTNFNFPTHYWIIIYMASVIAATAFLFVAKATRHMELSLSSPLFTFNPIIVAFLAWVILKEELVLNQIIGIAIIFLGSYFLEMKPKKSFTRELLTPFKVIARSRYVHFMLFAVFLYALTALIDRYVLHATGAVSPFTYLLIIQFFVAVNYLILITLFHDGFKGIKHGFKSAGGWIVLMAFVMLVSRTMQVYVITLPAAKIAMIIAMKRGSTVLTTFFGGEIFHDKHIKQRTLSSLVMVLGTIIMIL